MAKLGGRGPAPRTSNATGGGRLGAKAGSRGGGGARNAGRSSFGPVTSNASGQGGTSARGEQRKQTSAGHGAQRAALTRQGPVRQLPSPYPKQK